MGMDSTADESFTISSKESLLQAQQSSPPKPQFNKNLIPILFSLLIVFILFVGSMILSSKRNHIIPDPFNSHLYGPSQYYCHLTRFPDLCYLSMSTFLNHTPIDSNPNPIFSASIRIAVNQLKDCSFSIIKSLSSSTNNTESSLRECEKSVGDSLSQLSESLNAFGLDWNIESLTYAEIDRVKVRGFAASRGAFKCLLALKEIGSVVEGEEKKGVDEVKYGVEIAKKYIMNSVKLIDARESILDDFYNSPVNQNDDYYYNYYDYSYDVFDFTFLVCLYSGLYLFLALLYFLFWRSD